MLENQLSLISEDDANCGKEKKPLLLSASRRTDLPGFYPQECADIIRQKVRRLRTRYLYGVMFWSKQPLPFLSHTALRTLVCELQNPILQLTVTGLGGTLLEPGIPTADQIFNIMPALIDLFKGDPERIRWRFDPILYQKNGIQTFASLAERMSNLGINECTISFPTYFSLKGALETQFESAAIPKWNSDVQQQFLQELVNVANALKITLRACAQPIISEMQPGIQPATCIDANLFQCLHPQKRPLILPKDYSQRKHCNCVQSEDIGSYTKHLCYGGCAYCYSKAGGQSGENHPRINRARLSNFKM